MPVMNGFELLDYVKKDDNLKNIPVIFITAEAEREKIVESIKAGLDAYITKPFSLFTMIFFTSRSLWKKVFLINIMNTDFIHSFNHTPWRNIFLHIFPGNRNILPVHLLNNSVNFIPPKNTIKHSLKSSK